MADIAYPRVTIEFCTQCKWNLRAAYFAQELLQTFSTGIGEISLLPSIGGVFIVKIQYRSDDGSGEIKTSTLWDRKAEGGFPETKDLKRRVRDIIQPGRDLGHVDGHKKPTATDEATAAVQKAALPESSKDDQSKEQCAECQ